jgi:hypothetical protein
MGKEFTMKKMLLSLCLVLLLLMLTGCGGGTSSPIPLPQNKAIVILAKLKQGLINTSTPIRAIEVTFVLPKSALPILKTDGSLNISDTGLKNLNSNNNSSIPDGSYDPNTGTVKFAIILLSNDPTSSLSIGEIARFTYETTSGIELSSLDIQPVFTVVGTDLADISSEIVPSVSLVTYQKP